ncbi:MAG: hypothetical protein J7641_05555 [Cyanobacteria bacterium SID2]|nr:hypothetical protein [Cyanobacteria bacterium SID2]MBP0003183.1 hypothetical protein [Cyanobacteria bacterium SBC]
MSNSIHQDSTSQTDDPPVTLSVARKVKPGCEEAFEKFISGVTAAAMTFEGYLGATIIRPSDPKDLEYRIIFKFDRRSNLLRWQESECRRQWLARAESLTLGSPIIEVLTGLETWFTLSSRQPVIPPPRYKMAVVTWIAIFPLVNLINVLLGPALAPLAPVGRSFVSTAILVPLMTYVVMPRMTRLFAKWLYPRRRR